MSHGRLVLFFVIAGLAELALSGVAHGIIGPEYHFPIFGVVNGTQTARINAVLTPPPDTDLPCPGELAFIDSQGQRLGGAATIQLRGGVAAHTDFLGNPDARVGDRLRIRAQMTLGDPADFPGCVGAVLVSVEVIDRLTHVTHVILTNPVKVEPVR